MSRERLCARSLRRFCILALLPVFVFAASGCTIPVYHEVGSADTIITEIEKLLSDVDSATTEAKLFADKVRNDALSKETMSQNKSKAVEHEQKLGDAKKKLDDAQGKIGEMNSLRLPAWYEEEYVGALSESVTKRREMVSAAEDLVFQSKSLATAIASYYSATARMEIIGTKFEQIPEIDLNNPSTITLASQVLDEIIKETKTAQTEYNDAAASVNVSVFTKFRDAVVALGKVSDALNELNMTYAQMLQAIQTQNEGVLVDALNRLPVLLEAVLVALDDFVNKLPVEYVDTNGDLNVKAQNEIQDWKNSAFTTPASAYTAAENAAKDADDATLKIYNENQ